MMRRCLKTVMACMLEEKDLPPGGMNLFLTYIKHDLLELARFLIIDGFDVNKFKDEEGMTLLFYTIRLRKRDFFDLIIVHVDDVNTCSCKGFTPLHLAAALDEEFYDDSEYFIKSLIKQGANVEALSKKKKTPLHFAVESGPPAKVKLFLESGTNSSLPEYDDLFDIASTLPRASMRKTTEYLMDHGFVAAEYLVSDSDFLCNAVDGGCYRLVKDLLQRGANPNKKVDGLSILQAACNKKDRGMVQLLIDFGVDLKICEDALVAAVNRSQPDIVEMLLKREVPRTMSHLMYVAVGFSSESTLECLLRYERPSFNVNSMLGVRTLTHAALKRPNPRNAEILWEFGVDFNHRYNEFGNTPLHSACWDANADIIKVLLELGADVNAINKYGKTPPEEIPTYCPPEAAIYFREHIAALHSAGLYVSSACLAFLAAGCDPNIQSKYCVEIKMLKSTIIPNTRISFYQILKCTPNEIANLASNHDIINAFFSEDYQHIFPCYYNLLKWKIKTGFKRRTLMDEFSKNILPTMGAFSRLPWICTQSILSSFSIEQLGIIVGQFQKRQVFRRSSVHSYTRFYRIFPQTAERKQKRHGVLNIPPGLI